MSLHAAATTPNFDASRYAGLSAEQLIRMYRVMFMSRKIDDREVQLKRQHKIYFQISGAGHEAILVAAGEALKPAHDWFFPYYRDRALCLMLGISPYDMLLQSVGAKDDPASGGRQMPSHWGQPKLNIVERSSTAGMQWLHAVGAAEASVYYERIPQALAQAQRTPMGQNVRHFADEVVYVSGGEGMTSEGEFFEAINSACLQSLPRIVSDRRQRLGDFGSGRGADGRRQHFPPADQIPRLARRRMRWHRSAGQLCGHAACGGILPRAKRPRAGARSRHASLLPFAFR